MMLVLILSADNRERELTSTWRFGEEVQTAQKLEKSENVSYWVFLWFPESEKGKILLTSKLCRPAAAFQANFRRFGLLRLT